MRPISGGSDPYGLRARHALAARRVPRVPRVVEPLPPDLRAVGDVELSIRVLADGGSITVRRRTVVDEQGTRRTVGIDAVVR